VLLERLAALAGVPVEVSDAWGIPADAREAVMFAALAYLSALRVPLELPGTPPGHAAVAGQWDLSVAPLPALPAVTGAAPQRLRVHTREERP
jgi:anhydro-N-acetylmuramic acid kinase